ncbi:uncharacterized protein LOC129581725 [Paramacrobiotus metropolitanus]|uniref:uncharacterized protein LOC129581725 n=1 Tax=Paramacrobiotus metropolitanus TaxID=2943436 RepID=UPI0024458649|nr:uncharacterized protein LOC129581725 [Paramacrobiotus metropolitanus]XP_055328914.1 uncharacterized protein LOC129581725 [Paramacrobiotus metropolitanus]
MDSSAQPSQLVVVPNAEGETSAVLGWDNLEIDGTFLMKLPYHNSLITVFQKNLTLHGKTVVQYVYTPLLLLQPETARIQTHPGTGAHMVTFEILLRDLRVEKYIRDQLKTDMNVDVGLGSVVPVPIRNIRLKSLEPSPLYTVDTAWRNNASSRRTVTFRLFCTEAANCETVRKCITEEPDWLVDNLVVQCDVQSQKSVRRTINVTAEHVRTTGLISKLEQQFPGRDVIYMKSDDAKQLALDIKTNIVASEITDGEFVSTDASLSLMPLVDSVLSLENVDTKQFSSEMWSSTFWHDDNARPDKIARTLNEVYDKSDSQTKALMRNELAEASKSFDKNNASNEAHFTLSQKDSEKTTYDKEDDSASKWNFSAEAKILKFGGKTSMGGESSHQEKLGTSHSKDADFGGSLRTANAHAEEHSKDASKSSRNEDDRLNNLLKEAKDVAHWEGERFVPKPMNLSRLNMAKLKSSNTLQTAQIQITRTTNILESNINVPDAANPSGIVQPSSSVSEQAEDIPSGQPRYLDQIILSSGHMTPGKPDIYEVKLEKFAVNAELKLQRYRAGTKPQPAVLKKVKVMLLVGPTGSGKTTYINAVCNVFFGVTFRDRARLKLIVEHRKQTQSVTDCVTAYELYTNYDSPCPFNLVLIDTPGFGHTDGVASDGKITAQLSELFSSDNPIFCDIQDIDAVGIVMQSGEKRLTPTQMYVIDCVLSVFGKDFEKNIILLCTHADTTSSEPNLLAAMNEYRVPYGRYYKLNNCSLYADNTGENGARNKPYWDDTRRSIVQLFDYLGQIEPQNKTLTHNVLRQRNALETAVASLNKQVQQGLGKMEKLRKEKSIIEDSQAHMEVNANHTRTVPDVRPTRVPLIAGEYVTNCTRCLITCHHMCIYPNNEDKAKCSAMNPSGTCNNCQCHWKVHENAGYRHHYETVQVEKTFEDIKALYEKASGTKLTAEGVFRAVRRDMIDTRKNILQLLITCNRCHNQLSEIALRPNPTSTVQYIEVLINSENLNRRPGFEERISTLEELKQLAARITDLGADPEKVRKEIEESLNFDSL